MSGLAAIFNLDGRPVDPSQVTTMLHAAAHRGPDGFGHWCRGTVALGHARLNTTPESLRERQPAALTTGDVWGVLDGRLDNRADLIAAVEPPDGAEISDM